MCRSTLFCFTCRCGAAFHRPIYHYVNTAQNPQLQYIVLAGLLNVSTCPQCGRRVALARPFIYSDPAHSLLVYVDPRSDVPTDDRRQILEKLRGAYVVDVEQRGGASEREREAVSEIAAQAAQNLPPLRIVFGLQHLNKLINSSLSQDERLGRLALSTRSRSDAERGRMLDIARKLASEMSCQIDVEDLPEEYTVWMYGSRRQISALMREFAPRG